jgi:hypothetical protein
MGKSRAKREVVEVREPAFPSYVWSPLGLVEVVEVDELTDDDGRTLNGMYSHSTRKIQIVKGLHPVTKWQALGHEMTHMLMYDAGADMPVYESEKIDFNETVCIAFGSFMAAFVMQFGYFPFSDGNG